MRGALWTVIVLGIGTVIGIGLVRIAERDRSTPPTEPAASRLEQPDFAPIVERSLPAVVSVRVERRFRHDEIALGEDESWEDLDPRFRAEEFEIPAAGSGFLIDPSGHVLTNDHVVRHADRIDVHFADGRTSRARLVGRDPMTDIAVLRVEEEGPLPTLPIGDSDAVRIGEWVIAIGNPLGMLEGSVTLGIVSGKDRRGIGIRGGGPSYQDFIQTDASINPGNSGGPLVNGDGEVIGVNTAYNAPGGGIGFAIAINMARRIAGQLIEIGRVPRGFLGVGLIELDPALVRGWDLGRTRGAVITEVRDGTPAARAGLQVGDILVAFDGIEVEGVQPFRLLVAGTEVGREVPIRYLRRGEPRRTRIRLVERTDPVPSLPEQPRGEPATDLGLFLSSAPPGDEGVQVDSVRVGGAAARAGLRAGDRLIRVGWEPAVDPEEATRMAEEQIARRGATVFEIRRGFLTTFLAVPRR